MRRATGAARRSGQSRHSPRPGLVERLSAARAWRLPRAAGFPEDVVDRWSTWVGVESTRSWEVWMTCGSCLSLVPGGAGQACQAFHDKTVRGLKSERVQCDECGHSSA